MNKAIKKIAANALIICAFSFVSFAEDLSVPDLIKAAEQPALQSAELSSKIARIREDMEKVITSAEASKAEFAALKNELRGLEEKMGEIKILAIEIGVLKSKLGSLEARYNEELNEIRKSADEFKDMKAVLDKRADAMKGWDDIIGVMKKQTGNTEMEIAGMKKDIKELKRQYAGGDDIIGSIVSWPYMGIAALIISIAAFIAAVAR